MTLTRDIGILGRLWSCALGGYSCAASGVAGKSDAVVAVPSALGAGEVRC